MRALQPIDKSNRLFWRLALPFLPSRHSGFTLLELMIVMIFAAILAAVAVPGFLNQAGKARQADMLLTLGAMNRGQQGYHFQKGTFAVTIADLGADMGGAIFSKYYNFPDPLPAEVDATKVKHLAVAKNPALDLVKDHALGVYFTDGAFTSTICRAAQVGDPVNVGNSKFDDCQNNGVKISN